MKIFIDIVFRIFWFITGILILLFTKYLLEKWSVGNGTILFSVVTLISSILFFLVFVTKVFPRNAVVQIHSYAMQYTISSLLIIIMILGFRFKFVWEGNNVYHTLHYLVSIILMFVCVLITKIDFRQSKFFLISALFYGISRFSIIILSANYVFTATNRISF